MSIRRLSTSTLTEQTRYALMSTKAGGAATATVSASTGSPATGTFTDSDGIAWNYYDFTGNGSITFDTEGFADVLVIGGGGGGARSTGSGRDIFCGGGAGQLIYGLQYVSATTLNITVGAGGAGVAGNVSAVRIGSKGSASTLDSLVRGNGGGEGVACGELRSIGITDGSSGSSGGLYISNTPNGTFRAEGGGAGGTPNNYDGVTLNYNDNSIVYGLGGDATTGAANTGSGGIESGGTGTNGRVIVKVLA